MKEMKKRSKSLPFWSWNDKLEKEELFKQIDWMKACGFGGFFMHARAGLKTEYLSQEWFDCINACIKYAKELGMEAWAYDENGYPSGFVGGELLKDENNLEWYLTVGCGAVDSNAIVSYDISGESLCRIEKDTVCEMALNVYKHNSVSTVDILDNEVVDKFIEKTHDRYKVETKELFSSLEGFFTDEPQYYRKGTPFPHKIADFFQKEYGEDILDCLGLLFVERAGFRRFRYRYWKACQVLMLNNFAKPIYDWCDANKLKLTGHYIEERDLFGQMLFNSGIMPFYEYEHIPGIDWLCRRFMSVVPARQVGSVAAQLGKKEVLTETFAMTGWDVTPQELKAMAEFQYLYGANKTCQHLLPYSEKHERKRDHPMHFTPLNPWVEPGMKPFNDYFDWLGGLMQESVEDVQVAVLHPIRSAYFHYQYNQPSSTEELDSALLKLSNKLAENQIGFHFIDETLLAKYGSIQEGKIVCGACSYTYLIIPKCYTMDASTEKLLKAFVGNGGKVYLADEKPRYREGEEYDYEYLESNITFDDIKKAQPYEIESNIPVYSAYRKSRFGDFVFLVNISSEATAKVKLSVKGKEFLSEYDYATEIAYDSDGSISIKPCQSKLIIIRKGEKKRKENETVLLSGNFEVKERDNNTYLLDFARFSIDGKTYSDLLPIASIFQHLLSMRYEGSLKLEFIFEVRELPTRIHIQSEYDEKTRLWVNGRETQEDDVTNFIKLGENTITLQLYFYEKESVYFALFGEGVSENLRNCLVYDTYLENLYLQGDFGVFSKNGFRKGKEKNVLVADSFYMGKRQDCVGELVQSGEPFFSGRIVLKKFINLSTTNVNLKINARVHYAKVYVNGKLAGTCLFDNEVDISHCAKIGENNVEIELFTSPRNMFGPHHNAKNEEPLLLSPQSFACDIKDNEAAVGFRQSYAFIQAGILKENECADINMIYYGIND